MLMLEDKKVFEQLSNSFGISGEEEGIIKLIQETITPFVDECRITPLGNLIATKKGLNQNHPTLMISTHIDEIGCVVSSILPGGFLRVEPRGGVDPKILPSQEMVIVTDTDQLSAVFAMIPPHLIKPEEKGKVSGYDQLILDTGLAEEEVKQKVRIGSPVIFKGRFTPLLNGRFSGKTFDNRASAMASILLLQELSYVKHNWDILCVFSTQEEVGCKGAETAANAIYPKIAIACDATFGEQPDLTEFDGYKLGEGVPVGIGPNFTRKISTDLLQAGKDNEIKTVLEPTSHPGGTDAGPIQVAHMGIPTGLLSIPVRYMHAPTETLDWKDIKNAVKLLLAYIRTLDQSYLEALL
jgi:putative aminopeptidase FrvX